MKIDSPPRTLLVIGVFGVENGALFLVMAAINRAQGQASLFRPLQGLLLYLGGLMLVLTMFFRMEYTWDIFLNSYSAYIAVSISVPLYYAAIWKAARHPWAAASMTAIYTLFLIDRPAMEGSAMEPVMVSGNHRHTRTCPLAMNP